MSHLHDFPQPIVEMVVATLLSLILSTSDCDPEAAASLAAEMLAEYQPKTVRELRMAAAVIGLSLNGLRALTETGDPSLTPQRLTALRREACTLNRSELQVLRKLEEMQRNRQTEATEPPQQAPTPESIPAARQPAEPPSPEQKAFNSASKLLRLMQSQFDGAPPPGSPAEQQIEEQRRVVEASRLKLEQASLRAAEPCQFAQPIPAAA